MEGKGEIFFQKEMVTFSCGKEQERDGKRKKYPFESV